MESGVEAGTGDAAIVGEPGAMGVAEGGGAVVCGLSGEGGVITVASGRYRDESPAPLSNCAASCGTGSATEKYRPNAQTVATAKVQSEMLQPGRKALTEVAGSDSKSASSESGAGGLSGNGGLAGAMDCFIRALAYGKVAIRTIPALSGRCG